jgi:hypothetical protein
LGALQKVLEWSTQIWLPCLVYVSPYGSLLIFMGSIHFIPFLDDYLCVPGNNNWCPGCKWCLEKDGADCCEQKFQPDNCMEYICSTSGFNILLSLKNCMVDLVELWISKNTLCTWSIISDFCHLLLYMENFL